MINQLEYLKYNSSMPLSTLAVRIMEKFTAIYSNFFSSLECSLIWKFFGNVLKFDGTEHFSNEKLFRPTTD